MSYVQIILGKPKANENQELGIIHKVKNIRQLRCGWWREERERKTYRREGYIDIVEGHIENLKK